MKFKLIALLFTLCLLPVIPVKNIYAGTINGDSVSLRSNFVPPRILPGVQKKSMGRLDASVLEENGYYYRYKGQPIKLLRIKDRITLAYKENKPKTTQQFKQKQLFQNAGFRSYRVGRKAFEIMTVDKKMVENKSAQEIYHNIVAAVENDSSVAFAAPVYYEPQSGEEVILTDRIAVKVSDDKDVSLRETIASTIDAEFEQVLMPQVIVFKCNNMSSRDALQRCIALDHTPGVLWAQPEMSTKIEKYYVPNDPLYNMQWNHQNTGVNGGVAGADMKVTSAWDIQHMGDTNITIAVLDQGVDLTHSDLSIKAGGWDFSHNDNDPSPSSSADNHGTAVAGIAAAIGNNGIGVAGVAAGAKILPIKMMDDIVNLTDVEIASAFNRADSQGVDVINCSWGQNTGRPDNILETAIINASTLGRGGKGCPVFCASGNDASSFTTRSLAFPTSNYYVAFVYKKDAAGSAGDDNIIIDNVTLCDSLGSSVVFNETFSGTSLPAGWATSGGNNGSVNPDTTVPGWNRDTTIYQQGFGGQASYRSGAIGNDQWTELRMPYRAYHAGEKLVFNVRTSTENDHDSLKYRLYGFDGAFLYEKGVSSGLPSSSISAIAFPAGFDSAIAVGASTDLDYRSDYSQYDVSGTGKTVDFVAPSGGGFHQVPTTDRTGADGYDTSDYYVKFSGTSCATPEASGLAALILSKNPQLSRNKVLEVMRSSCDKIGEVTYTGGVHKEYGYGRLNARKALENLPPVITGQHPVIILKNGTITLTTDDLVIFDTETPDGPFTLTVGSGSNYSVSGTTITADSGFVGTLAVPVSVNDGTFNSDQYTLSVTVRATNAAPVISGPSVLTMLEDGKLRIVAGDLTITDSDDPRGPFVIAVDSGTNYTVVGDTVFPVADFNGTLSIPVTASDKFTASAPFNVNVTVTPVNDAPSFAVETDATVDEDCGTYTIANWASGVSAGPPNESGQSISFVATTNNDALFAVLPAVSSDGILSFTPANNANGTATVTVRLYDKGDITNGGSNASGAQVFTITVRAVNDPPVFIPGADVSVSEDAGAQTIPVWASGIGPGGADETGLYLHFTLSTSNDALFSVLPSIAENGTLNFTAAPDGFGSARVMVRLHDDGGGNDSSVTDTFTISISPVNDPPAFTAGSSQIVNEDAGPKIITSWAGAISAGPKETDTLHFVLTNSRPALFSSLPIITDHGDLMFTPATNVSGVDTITVRLHDGLDSSALATFIITLLPVNDPPEFAADSVVYVPEDAGSQVLPGWARISSGALDEATQIVGISIKVSDTTLFSVQPSVTIDGTLSFTSTANHYGSSTVTVTLTDDGETINGGVTTTVAAPFTISILPVNDAPAFTPGGEVTVHEDGGNQSFENWATYISAGPGDSAQKLSFSVVTTNAALFSSLPAIDTAGTLTFTTAPDANGLANVKVRLHDNGGTEHGGTDSSTEAVFAINILAVNDTPRIAISGNHDMVLGTETVISISATDVDGEIPQIRLKNIPSFVTFATAAGSGIATLTCKPLTDTGTFLITVITDDSKDSSVTTLTLRVRDVPPGAILISGVTSQAITRMYASAGWIGIPVLTGPGTITNVKPGTCLLAISDSGARTGYYYSVVSSDAVDTVSVVSHPRVPVMFAASDTLRTISGPINACGPVSVVIDDIDNDGKPDIAYVGYNGVVRFCRGNGVSFADPVSIHTGKSEKNVLRCVDWNNDGINDLLMVNVDGTVQLSRGKTGGLFSNDSLLFTTDPGCTGMELAGNQTAEKGIYLGFSNGTIQYVTIANDGSRTTRMVRDKAGQILDVGDDANVIAFDITGDGLNDLLVGNSLGTVQSFTLKSVDTVSLPGMVTTGGMPLGIRVGMLSSTFGTGTALPSIVYADGNGTLFVSASILRGDITNDGTVDVLDLQQLGIHWGQRAGDTGWLGAANLSVNTASSDPQVLNVLDMQILGNFWGLKK